MSWTPGTWADVALGDDVLGGDSYPWTVVDALVNHFDTYGDPASVRVTIERDGAGRRTADIMITKPVKYQPFDTDGVYVRRLLKCTDCLSGHGRCMPHGSPDQGIPPTLRDQPSAVNDDSLCAEVNSKTTAGSSSSPGRSGTDADSGTAPCSTASAPEPPQPLTSSVASTTGVTAPRTYAGDAEAPGPATSILEVPRETEIAGGQMSPEDLAAVEAFERFLAEREPAPPGAPHVEYDESERAAASALKAAGITAKVIERVMSLEGLASHLLDTHGVELPERDTAHGRLLGVEYRALLADLHFEKHAEEQEPGEEWKPRGRTPHVHPVMDRPMDIKR